MLCGLSAQDRGNAEVGTVNPLSLANRATPFSKSEFVYPAVKAHASGPVSRRHGHLIEYRANVVCGGVEQLLSIATSGADGYPVHERQRPRPLRRRARRGRLVLDRPPQRATPPERNMIARRRWFRYWAPQMTQRGYVCTGRAKVQTKPRPDACRTGPQRQESFQK